MDTKRNAVIVTGVMLAIAGVALAADNTVETIRLDPSVIAAVTTPQPPTAANLTATGTKTVASDVVNEQTKRKKIADTISAVPEKTGNTVLSGLQVFSDWAEEHSGRRFETKWNKPATSMPEGFARERDPAHGS